MIPGTPMETGRVQVDGAAIDTFYYELGTIIEGIPATLIYDMDEVGYSDWPDAREVIILVPDIGGQKVRRMVSSTASS
jgi:hypothetical protein